MSDIPWIVLIFGGCIASVLLMAIFGLITNIVGDGDEEDGARAIWRWLKNEYQDDETRKWAEE